MVLGIDRESMVVGFGPAERVDSLGRAPLGSALAQYDVARSLGDVESAWTLLYHAYHRAGFIKRNRDRLHTVPQARDRDTLVIVRRRRKKIESTISFIPDGRLGLPLDRVYPEFFTQLRAEGRRAFEIGLFADLDGATGPASFTDFFGMFRLIYWFAVHNEITDLVAGVHPRRAKMLARCFGLKPVAEVRAYPLDRSQPVVLLRGDLVAYLNDPEPFKLMEHVLANPVPPEFFRGRIKLDEGWIDESEIAKFFHDRQLVAA